MRLNGILDLKMEDPSLEVGRADPWPPVDPPLDILIFIIRSIVSVYMSSRINGDANGSFSIHQMHVWVVLLSKWQMGAARHCQIWTTDVGILLLAVYALPCRPIYTSPRQRVRFVSRRWIIQCLSVGLFIGTSQEILQSKNSRSIIVTWHYLIMDHSFCTINNGSQFTPPINEVFINTINESRLLVWKD